MKHQHDIFYVIERLRKKDVNPRFCDLIEQKFRLQQTLSAFDLYQLRKVCYRFLKFWFDPEWAANILVLQAPTYQRIHTEGDPEIGHVFYKKPGREKQSKQPGFKKTVARGLAYDRDKQLDKQFLLSLQKDETYVNATAQSI